MTNLTFIRIIRIIIIGWSFVSFMILRDTCKSIRECLALMVWHSIGWNIGCSSIMAWGVVWIEWLGWLVWFIDLFFFLFGTLRFWLWARNRTSWSMSITIQGSFLVLSLANNSCNFVEFWSLEFLHYHLKLWLLNENCKLVETFCTALYLINGIMNTKFLYQLS